MVGEREDGKNPLTEGPIRYCDLCGLGRGASVCLEFGADRAHRRIWPGHSSGDDKPANDRMILYPAQIHPISTSKQVANE
jgi:hypothetical protein